MSEYIQLTQEIKNLDRETLLKLSGFLDALLIGNVASNTVTPSSDAALEVVVAFASQTSNAESIALQIAESLQAASRTIKVCDVAELNVKKLTHIPYLIIIASTHGEGEPPDTAIQFYENLKSNRAPEMEQTQFAVLALGDSSYEQFCAFGVWIDERLRELKATPLLTRVDCDVDYESTVVEWQSEIVKQFDAQQQVQSTTERQVATSTEANVYTAKNPLSVEVINAVNLCTDLADKQVYHVELDVPSNQINYVPGDSLGVCVSNPAEMVNDIMEISDLSEEEQVVFNGNKMSFRQCLDDEVELFRITKKQVSSLVSEYPNLKLGKILDSEDKISEFIFSQDWLSLLRYYTKIGFGTAQDFINLLNPKSQRLYSISSSSLAHEDEVHLAIRLREFGKEKHLGLVSRTVSRFQESDKANVFLKPNKNFRLPEDPNTPIIMIGTGTGIAPFRAFLYHRLELNISSPAWLFFGEQSFRESFLYQTDWLNFLKKNVLSELTVAFSRDTDKPVYVQNRLHEHAKEVYQWIERGAHVYVCGSAEGMASSVHEALQHIIMEQSGVNEEAAKQRLQQLMIEGFYKRDVY